MNYANARPFSQSKVLKFAGRFALDPHRRELSVDGAQVVIGARAFDLLNALAQNSGRELTKAELLSLAWPNLTVDENNLHVQISALRKALGFDLIATIPGRGYQFKVAVTAEAMSKASKRRRDSAAFKAELKPHLLPLRSN